MREETATKTMANGDPVPWSKLIKDHGFSTVLAVALLGAVLGWIPSPMLTAHLKLISQMDSHVKDDGTRTYLLRLICQRLSGEREDPYKCLQDSVNGH